MSTCIRMLIYLYIGGTAVIKAQVLAGGRGKGHFDSGLQGGVKAANRYTCTCVCVYKHNIHVILLILHP